MCVHKTPFAEQHKQHKARKSGGEREAERRYLLKATLGARDLIPYSRKFQTAFRHLLYCSVCPHFAACLVLIVDVAVAVCRGMCSCPHSVRALLSTVRAGRITSLHTSRSIGYGRKRPRSTNTCGRFREWSQEYEAFLLFVSGISGRASVQRL